MLHGQTQPKQKQLKKRTVKLEPSELQASPSFSKNM